jgi:hypothetical protein
MGRESWEGRRRSLLEQAARRVPGGFIAAAGIERIDRMLDRVPVLAWFRSRLYQVEESALEALRDRLAQLDGALPIGVGVSGAFTSQVAAAPADGAVWALSPAEAFTKLLDAADMQSPSEARMEAVVRIIRQLVPDEARILRALSDGSEFAVLQAYDGNDHIVRNRSNVGRNAKVHAQELTPTYVTHLLELGLVELAPYEGTSLYEYELIEAESEVRQILGHYDHRKLMKPKISRQVLRLSASGRKFCDLVSPR